MPAGRLCAIHQPNFFPRLSTLAKLYTADCWVVLKDVQFVRRDYQHRARLAALHDPGRYQWLSLPVYLPHGRSTKIPDVRLVDSEKSRRRVALTIQQYYGRSPHWPTLRSALDEILDVFERTDRVMDVAEASTRVLLNMLGWQGDVLDSTELHARPGRSERLADLTRAVGGRRYLCGTGGARYLDITPFRAADLPVEHFATPLDRVTAWHAANRLSALWALMELGPVELARHLQVHAQHWRS
jgi:hypothetical protein